MGIHCDGARKNQQRMPEAGLPSVGVPCAVESDGVLGCIKCHKALAQAGLSAGHDLFVIMEGNAVPRDCFDVRVVNATLAYLRAHPEENYVMLGQWPAILPTTFAEPFVVKRAPVHGSFAYAVTREFARTIVSDPFRNPEGGNQPVDLWLMERARHRQQAAAYPMPITRASDLVSYASPVFNGGAHKAMRRLVLHPKVLDAFEWVSVNLALLASLLIVAIVGAACAIVAYVSSSSRNRNAVQRVPSSYTST